MGAMMSISISESFEAWNRCNLSDDQLDVVIDSLCTSIVTLREVGGGSLITGALYEILSSAEYMKSCRKDEKRNK